jgi:hypothetical protein
MFFAGWLAPRDDVRCKTRPCAGLILQAGEATLKTASVSRPIGIGIVRYHLQTGTPPCSSLPGGRGTSPGPCGRSERA